MSIWFLPPPFNMIVLIIAIICSVELVKSLLKQVRRYADNEADRNLKRELFEGGASVEEAERWAAIRFARADEDERPSAADVVARDH